MQKLSYSILYIILVVSASWSFMASIHDMEYDYDVSAQLHAFIEEYQLDAYPIAISAASNLTDEEGNLVYHLYSNLAVLLYYDHNIFINLNGGSDTDLYSHHYPTDKSTLTTIPDVMIGNIRNEYRDELEGISYVLVKELYSTSIWKGYYFSSVLPSAYVFIREDKVTQLLGTDYVLPET